MEALQKSGCGGSSSDSMVTAGYAGPVQLLGGLVADPGASGGGLAEQDLDVVVHGVPEVYLEETGLQADALVAGPLVQDATGCQMNASLGYHFLQLEQRSSFTFSGGQPAKSNNHRKKNKLVQLILTVNLWRGFYFL